MKRKRQFACRDNEIHHFYNTFSLSVFLSPSISDCFSLPPHPAPNTLHSFTSQLPQSSSLSLSPLPPLLFQLAATADLNNSAQAGILQGPIVCARQENEER